MKKNERYEIDIDGLGKNGEGIGRLDGFAFFVEGAIPGDRVEMHILKIKNAYGYGKLVRVITPSANRAEPPCPVFARCGGCTLQHMTYAAQLDIKTKQVVDALARIGGMGDVPVEGTLGMEVPYAYRNKAQFPIRAVDGKPRAGFFAARSHALVPVEDCCTQHPANQAILQTVLVFMEEHGITCYDEKTHKGLVRHVLTRCGYHTKEIMVCLVLNGKKLPYSEVLAERLAALDGVVSVVANINTARTNVILGGECRTIWGKPHIIDTIGGLRFEISPLSFFQVNPLQTQALYNTALALADVKAADVVADVYCGIGTLSLFFAQKAKVVYGIEVVPQAIEDARRNAEANGVTNATFIADRAENAMPALVAEGIRADVVVIDPPRKGCEAAVLDAIGEMAPRKVVYVSCDPATMARDVRVLGNKGYAVCAVQPVDMFPQTGHVETVVALSHKKADRYITVDVEFGEGEGLIPLDEITERAEAQKPTARVTYAMIQAHIEENYGFKVHTAYIAEVKRALGLPMFDAPNAVEELKQPRQHPTERQEEAIKDALKHFGII